jgi:hypothetical protein
MGGGLTAACRDAIKTLPLTSGGAVAQLAARLHGMEEAVGSNPTGSTRFDEGFGVPRVSRAPAKLRLCTTATKLG